MSTLTPTLNLKTLPEFVKLWVEVRDLKSQLDPRVTKEKERYQAEFESVIGQVLEHIAYSNVQILGVSWNIQGLQYTVTDYAPTLQVGQVTRVTQWDLNHNPIRFCWWKPGTYVVTCNISTPYGIGQVSHSFEVTAPIVKSFTAVTGIVGVGIYQNREFLRLARSIPEFQRDGIVMNCIIGGVQSVAGTIAGIQLASNQRFCILDNGSAQKINTNGEYILDIGMTNTIFYQSTVEQLPNDGEDISYDANDGPGGEVNAEIIKSLMIGDGDDDPHIPEMYKLFIMFRPEVPGGIWVPIKLMEWGWEGVTNFNVNQQRWEAASETNIPIPLVNDPDHFPEWNKNTSQSQWVAFHQ